jgi:hypothetical protein
MLMRKPWISSLINGLFCLALVLSCLNCGGSSNTADPGANTGGNPEAGYTGPVSDYSDYVFEEPAVSGNTYYIDPVNGSESGDGSEQHPWRTLQQVIEDGLIQCYRPSETSNPDSELEVVNENAPVKGGDRLLLRSGYHGHVALNAFVFKQWLTIAAQEGQTPVLSQFKLQGAFEKIYLKGLTLLKDSYEGSGNYWEADSINHNSDACLYLASDSFWGNGSQVKVNGLWVGTTKDASAWTADDWVEKSAAGISLRSATSCEIVNCHIENISFGLNIEYASDHTAAVGNTIKYFSGDGCRLISNDVYLAYNTITDCLKVDDNHDDAIQSYSRGADNSPGTGVLYDNVLRGNLIIGTTDFSNPLAGSPQGIGCFDGFFDGWTVENNVVIVDHYHGISFYGMRNSFILNNTVIDQNHDNDISPWIMVTDHKNGTPSRNCIVANNIAYRSISASGTDVTADHNFVVGRDNPDVLYDLFVDPDNLDFHLLVNDTTLADIIDQGASFADMASSAIDRDGVIRSGAPDLGAYEAVP